MTALRASEPVWYHVHGVAPPTAATAIHQDLTARGVRLCNAPLGGQSAGIVAFGEVDADLLATIRDLSAGGLHRVLAIGTDDHPFSREAARSLLDAGASDVMAWTDHPEPGAAAVARLERWLAVDGLVDTPAVRETLVGECPRWLRLLREIVEVAHFTTMPVLIVGETGTGKELVGRLIHTMDVREPKGDLVLLDCTTIVPELAGSEFFGHEKGAFTGAFTNRDGAFALAHNGTLFLDEVGELPPGMQSQLLRAVQEHMYKRVGSNSWRRTDFRLVCATNRELEAAVTGGQFRRDLYYRLAGWICRLPALCARRADILPLASHFVRQLRPAGQPVEFDALVRHHLLTRDYPGNVRDLRQLVQRIMSRHVGPGPVTVGDLPEDELPRLASPCGGIDLCAAFEAAVTQALDQGLGLKAVGRLAEDAAERVVLDEEAGNLQRAARRLGVTDRTLQMRRAARRAHQVA